MTTQGERIVAVEVEVKALKDSFEDHKQKTDAELKEIKEMLSDLLALRNKGVGVFWLVSSLIGTGIVGGFFQLARWFLGHNG